MPEKWPTTPIPTGMESVKTCQYEETAAFLKRFQSLRGAAGRGWKIHHKKKGTPSVLVKFPEDDD
ncbi:unnamed protein product [marine sediment metagenome]|uniref:Uncharacterized protein n=1 Tax=marine sediment metagenome TaxID=412755 RepID=X0TJF2_9ZZZZ